MYSNDYNKCIKALKIDLNSEISLADQDKIISPLETISIDFAFFSELWVC